MDSVFLDLGVIKIYWYSIIMFFAILIAGWLVFREARRFHVPENFLEKLFLTLIPIAFIGARLYYVIFNWSYYSHNLLDIFKVWEGGLAIHGGIIAGLVWVLFYSKKYNIKPFLILDFIVVGLIIGQAIGRWGNFFNGEAHGPLTTLEHLKGLFLPNFIIEGMHIGGNYYIPTFFYESIWCVLGFILLLFIRRYKYIKIGQTSCIYLIWYGIGRFFIEGFRTDSLMLGSLKMAQIASLIMIIVGIVLFFVFHRGSKFQNQYNGGEEINE